MAAARRPVLSAAACAAAALCLLRAALAPAFVGGASLRGGRAQRAAAKALPSGSGGFGFLYEYQKTVYPNFEFGNEIGYFPDGTALNKAGNAMNHPETIGPDLHKDGSALVDSEYKADVGYFVDGTDVTKAGNALNHA